MLLCEGIVLYKFYHRHNRPYRKCARIAIEVAILPLCSVQVAYVAVNLPTKIVNEYNTWSLLLHNLQPPQLWNTIYYLCGVLVLLPMHHLHVTSI